MKAFVKNNTITVLIVIATVVLAGVATFTAVRLYQLRVQPVSPATPSDSSAQDFTTLSEIQAPSCQLNFTLTLADGSPLPTSSAKPSSSPKATATAKASATASAKPTASPKASSTPGIGGLSSTATPSSSPKATATAKASASASPRTTAVATASPSGELPAAGFGLPTIAGIIAGAILLLFALTLAL